MHRVRPAGMVRTHYRNVDLSKKIKHWLFEKYRPPADVSGDGYLLYDYYKIAEIVKKLPNAMERIRFVNPYERNWTVGERTWHRAWLPELFEPRRAWAVPPVPAFYDTLNFYKYITKSRIVADEEGRNRLDDYFQIIQNQFSAELVAKFEKRLHEHIVIYLRSQGGEVNMPLENILRTIFEDLFTVSSLANPNAGRLRISHAPRCESFWVRCGFKKLCKEHKIYLDEVENSDTPFIGDDRRKLGQLSFTMRDELISNARSVKPMRNLFDWSNADELYAPVFAKPIDLNNQVLFDPKVYKLDVDENILWQCPGYDADSTELHMYGVLALKDTSKLSERLGYWRPDSAAEETEIRREFYLSTALTSLFNWLNGQAHCLGHTQYTDIEAPLTSQLILSDGRDFCFAVSQLNTIAVNLDVEGFVNKHTNLCCVDGPYRLYDEFDASTGTFRYRAGATSAVDVDIDVLPPLQDGLNPHVVRRLLQMATNC